MSKTMLVMLSLAVALLPGAAAADWNEGEAAKWVQAPDLSPLGIDVDATLEFVLADDFPCTEPGPITGIHLWGSWQNDLLPQEGPESLTFTLSIHADIPASQSPTGYSMPGEPLWVRTFQPGTYTARIWKEGLQEGWMEPPDLYTFPGDHTCWQVNFEIPEVEAFVQEGSAAAPMVYWLDVQTSSDPSARFGWKTAVEPWNDTAVWGQGLEPYGGPWPRLIYPPTHELQGQPIHLAFVLTGPPPAPEMDFGDAPLDPNGNGYPTVLAMDGARHVPGNCWLGDATAAPDTEPDGQPEAGALGDDLTNLDDENGVGIPFMVIGTTATVTLEVAGGGVVEAWIDWNGDYVWQHPGEQVFAGYLPAGTHNFNVVVPAAAVPGTTFARFRISSQGGLLPTGAAVDGEVEDHWLQIVQQQGYKWDQPPDLATTGIDVDATCGGAACFVLADDFLCTQTGPLDEVWIWGSWLDDYLPEGDPRGVAFTLSIHADIPAGVGGPEYSMPGDVLWVRHFNPGEFTADLWAGGLQEGWLRPPADYAFPADHQCWLYRFDLGQETFLQTGTPEAPVVYWLDVQAHPIVEQARFGWKTSTQHWNDDATWGAGGEPYLGPWSELLYPPDHPLSPHSIDLAFRLLGHESPAYDFGDAPDPTYPTLHASGGAYHVIVPGMFLGSSVDAEADGQPSSDAQGDDLAGSDDEDGVTFTALRPTKPAIMTVLASLAGFVDAWVDWNADGDWADAGEQIAAAVPVSAGPNGLTFIVPAAAAPGLTFARVRYGSAGGLPFTGMASDGEVEDHQVEILESQVMKWQQMPDLGPMGIDVNATRQDGFILADDFACTSTGPLTDFHVYGSWIDDHLPFGQDPGAVRFTLSIHADIPAVPGGPDYSMPGEILWVRTFEPGSFEVELFAGQLEEGWLDPPDRYAFPADTQCFRYHFHVDPHLAFHQQGDPTHPIVYWLDVQAEPLDLEAHFGWKTSMEHWNDDAVWGLGGEPYPGPWNELLYPPPHELQGQSIDLAFAVLEDLITAVPPETELPSPRSELRQNAPNPFNPRTEISYVLPPDGGRVRLEIYDVMGRLRRVLVDAVQAGGEHHATWDGLDAQGRSLPAGVYFYRLRAADSDATMKMLLLR